MLLYAITDRGLLPASGAGNEPERRDALVSLTRTWAKNNIDYIQVREKDLEPAVLFTLTQQIVSAVRAESQHTRVLLNGPVEIALEANADGIHLPAGSPLSTAANARALFASAGRDAVISHSCHTREEVLKVREESQRNPYATIDNTLILYAPVFEKTIHGETLLPGQGLESLRAATEAAQNIPVLALGGITLQNAPACLAAGAAGIAAIRLFLGDEWHGLK